MDFVVRESDIALARRMAARLAQADNVMGGLFGDRMMETKVKAVELRELWRRELQPHQPACDLVIRARREAYAAAFEELQRDLLTWRRTVLGAG